MSKETYTREFKIEAVKLSYNTDKPLKEFVEELGISQSRLYRWRQEYDEDPDQAFPGTCSPGTAGKVSGKNGMPRLPA